MGILARHQNDDELAKNYFERSLKIRRHLGNRLGIAETLHRLGDLLAQNGDLQQGKLLLDESLDIFFDIYNRLGLAEVLEAYSRMALKKEKYKTSTEIFFSARTLRQTIGALPTLSEQKKHKNHLSKLKSALNKEDFQKAKTNGASLSLTQSIELTSKI